MFSQNSNTTSSLYIKNVTTIHRNSLLFVTHTILRYFADTTRTGSAQYQEGITLKAFIEGLSISFSYFIFQIILFSIFRNIFKSIYQPNALLQKRNFNKNWITTLFNSNINDFLSQKGLDAFFMLRYLKVLTIFFFILSIINLPLLLPIHYQANVSKKTLEMFNMSNIGTEKMTLHFVSCLFTIISLHFVMYSEISKTKQIIDNHIMKYKYQNILLICENRTTVIDMNQKFLKIGILNRIQYIAKNYKQLYLIWKRIYKMEETIEQIVFQIYLETYYRRIFTIVHSSYIRKIIYRLKCIGKYAIFCQKTLGIRLLSLLKRSGKNSLEAIQIISPASNFNESKFLYSRYMCLTDLIQQYNYLIEKYQYYRTRDENKQTADLLPNHVLKNVMILNFKTPFEAKLYKNLIEDEHYTTIAYQGLHPQDIIWKNMESHNRVIHFLKASLANILSIFVIVGWIIPVALIASISQIPYITLFFRNSKDKIFEPDFLSNIIMMILPVITLIILTEAVPLIFNFFAFLKGCKSRTEVEKDTQHWFFAFLFVHIFLVVTISSGISFIIENILDNPTNFPTLLAQELPKSSNFFCSFVIMRGLSYAGGNFLRFKQLLLELHRIIFTLSPPHKKLKTLRTSLLFRWGSIYPIFSILSCITLIYSVIAPLILPLACISFSIVNLSFQYLFIYEYNTENKSETFGKLYLHGLLQLYAGMYFLELCLLGIFSIGNRYDLVIYMLILLICTAIAHSKFTKHSAYEFSLTSLQDNDIKPTKSEEYVSMNNYFHTYQLPNIDYTKNLNKIWIPYDDYGVANEQKDTLYKLFGLICDIDKSYMGEDGHINFYN